MASDSEFLSTEELADLLKVSPATVENWRAVGGGPPYTRIVKTVRYRRKAVEQWLSENEFDSYAHERATAEQEGRTLNIGRPPKEKIEA